MSLTSCMCATQISNIDKQWLTKRGNIKDVHVYGIDKEVHYALEILNINVEGD